jgi:hypothetical protein
MNRHLPPRFVLRDFVKHSNRQRHPWEDPDRSMRPATASPVGIDRRTLSLGAVAWAAWCFGGFLKHRLVPHGPGRLVRSATELFQLWYPGCMDSVPQECCGGLLGGGFDVSPPGIRGRGLAAYREWMDRAIASTLVPRNRFGIGVAGRRRGWKHEGTMARERLELVLAWLGDASRSGQPVENQVILKITIARLCAFPHRPPAFRSGA